MKAFLLVHGAWQSGECWKKVASRLKAADHSVIIPELPWHEAIEQNNQQPLISCINYLINSISTYDTIIAVGHSIGGIFISQLADVIPDKMEKLVYISGFLLKSGQCANDTADLMIDSVVSRNMNLDKDKKNIVIPKSILREAMYHDMDDEDFAYAEELYRDQPLWTFQSAPSLTDEHFGRIPKFYIECQRDYAIPISAQRAMQGNWECQKVYSLNCSHSPFYSMPDELADLLTDL